MVNITINGNNEYGFENVVSCDKFRMENCHFINIDCKRLGYILQITSYPENVDYLVKNCTFDNCIVPSQKLIYVARASGNTQNSLLRVEDCSFNNIFGIEYSNAYIIGSEYIPILLSNFDYNFEFSFMEDIFNIPEAFVLANAVTVKGYVNELRIFLPESENGCQNPILTVEEYNKNNKIYVQTMFNNKNDTNRPLFLCKDCLNENTEHLEHIVFYGNGKEIEFIKRPKASLKVNCIMPNKSDFKVLPTTIIKDPGVFFGDTYGCPITYLISFPEGYKHYYNIQYPMEMYLEPYSESGNSWGIIGDGILNSQNLDFNVMFQAEDQDGQQYISICKFYKADNEFKITPHENLDYFNIPDIMDKIYSFNCVENPNDYNKRSYLIELTKISVDEIPTLILEIGTEYEISFSYYEYVEYPAVRYNVGARKTFIYNGEPTINLEFFKD